MCDIDATYKASNQCSLMHGSPGIPPEHEERSEHAQNGASLVGGALGDYSLASVSVYEEKRTSSRS